MDILSDVKITGSLTTVGDIKVGNYGSGVINVGEITGSLNNGSLEISGTINTVRTSEIIIGNKLNMALRSNSTAIFCNVSFGGGDSTLDLTGAKVVGLDIETRSIYKKTIPSNCSVFAIETVSCGYALYNHTKHVPVSSFMQYGDDWKLVQLDISFKRCTTSLTEMYALIGSFSQAFSEDKTMEFIVG